MAHADMLISIHEFALKLKLKRRQLVGLHRFQVSGADVPRVSRTVSSSRAAVRGKIAERKERVYRDASPIRALEDFLESVARAGG